MKEAKEVMGVDASYYDACNQFYCDALSPFQGVLRARVSAGLRATCG